jgi:hypothetical protein
LDGSRRHAQELANDLQMKEVKLGVANEQLRSLEVSLKSAQDSSAVQKAANRELEEQVDRLQRVLSQRDASLLSANERIQQMIKTLVTNEFIQPVCFYSCDVIYCYSDAQLKQELKSKQDECQLHQQQLHELHHGKGTEEKRNVCLHILSFISLFEISSFIGFE